MYMAISRPEKMEFYQLEREDRERDKKEEKAAASGDVYRSVRPDLRVRRFF